MARQEIAPRTRHTPRTAWWVACAWASIVLTGLAGLMGAAGLGT